jgi:hypothetical protein
MTNVQQEGCDLTTEQAIVHATTKWRVDEENNIVFVCLFENPFKYLTFTEG